MRKSTRNKAEKEVEINPFSQTLRIETYYSYSKTNLSGEFILRQEIKTLKEKADFTQLYNEHTFQIFRELDNSSKLLFMWIALHISWGAQKIELRAERVCDECGFSPATFYRVVDNLITFAVIAKSTSRDKTYWFNPVLFFKGHRLDAFPQCVIAPDSIPLL